MYLGHQDSSLRNRHEVGTPQNPRVHDLRGRTVFAGRVNDGDVGHGHSTRHVDRDAVNAPGVAVPQHLNITYSGRHGFHGHGQAPNPQVAPGDRYQAGHPLGRQFGGAGPYIAQNPQVNMGHGGAFPVWRAHENRIRQQAELSPVNVSTTAYYGPQQRYGH